MFNIFIYLNSTKGNIFHLQKWHLTLKFTDFVFSLQQQLKIIPATRNLIMPQYSFKIVYRDI